MRHDTVEAVLNEILRWGVPVPLGTIRSEYVAPIDTDDCVQGLPHALYVDDDYKGMRIPKGSLVFTLIISRILQGLTLLHRCLEIYGQPTYSLHIRHS